MIHIGEVNTLQILKTTKQGLYLVAEDDDDEEILLPNRYVSEDFEIGDMLDVFIYLDNEERIIATTDIPYIKRNEFALLRCSQVNDFGAFLDWGLVKQLFSPFKEQAFKMRPNGWYLVYCYLDEKTNRLVASSKTNRFLDNTTLTVKPFDRVDVIVSHPSDIGMNVIVNNTHSGLIYDNQIFSDINIGDRLQGTVQKIRKNNKLDIALGHIGYKNIEPNANYILDMLKKHDGFLSITDKSTPEIIKSKVQMSKKNFKKAIGHLYKKRLIKITPQGISLS